MLKICTKCKTEHPATKEYFYFEKRRDRLHPWCRECCKKAATKRRQQNPDYQKEYRQTERAKELHRQSQVLYRQRHLNYNKEYQKEYRNTAIGRLRRIYGSIKRRCNDPDSWDYKYYGGRGIQNKFTSSGEFVDYVQNVLRANPYGLEIDRIDNNGHYEKGNVRFVTHKENMNNR